MAHLLDGAEAPVSHPRCMRRAKKLGAGEFGVETKLVRVAEVAVIVERGPRGLSAQATSIADMLDVVNGGSA